MFFLWDADHEHSLPSLQDKGGHDMENSELKIIMCFCDCKSKDEI